MPAAEMPITRAKRGSSVLENGDVLAGVWRKSGYEWIDVEEATMSGK